MWNKTQSMKIINKLKTQVCYLKQNSNVVVSLLSKEQLLNSWKESQKHWGLCMYVYC